ncbi:glucosamine inositolphosphorylceramide transferase family protein [Sphingobium cloacae]|uniref:Glucosamine inositolphosphorylceramide transferase 1 N-terminal domain-containing protein n=1 Tax=Sphingobium cloacae TaxID=120107 RepID=A0A1E1EZP7_9SPHN|nr:hypothetical protein [Sphingobium cloacae]BAV63730.1 hypothetical protein SCLO_1006900 [Sphingobium cloacae]
MIRTDLWHVGVVKAPMARIVAAGTLEGFDTLWLPPEGSLRFIADPFGLWKDGLLHIFVEAYDYRTRHGAIELLILDENLALVERGPVLREPWHLSYPFIFEADGETWMLPEAHKSGRLTLYRATRFPWRWQPEERFLFPEAAIDATPVRTDRGWWIFYTPPAPKPWRTSALKLARADDLLGPWEPCGDAPVLLDKGGARMGGTPIRRGETLLLPTQDCRRTYGGAISIREMRWRDAAAPSFEAGPHIVAPHAFHPHVDGLHTLSQAGPVTLVDAKRTVRSFRHLAIRCAQALGLAVSPGPPRRPMPRPGA